MKNRKLFIISFLVVATLVTGVGFAALSGEMTFGGGVEYNGQGGASVKVKEAIILSVNETVPAINCKPSVSEHHMSMPVVFNDTDGSMNETASASYIVAYATSEEVPKIFLRSADELNGVGEGRQKLINITKTAESLSFGTFNIFVKWYSIDAETEEATPIDDNVRPELVNGQCVRLDVTVTFVVDQDSLQPEDKIAISNAEINASINGSILWATEEAAMGAAPIEG